MLSLAGLPCRTSDTHTRRSPVQSIIARLSPRRLRSDLLVKGLLGLSLPASLLTTSLPAAQPVASSHVAPAAVLAVASSMGAFLGDGAIADAAVDGRTALDGLAGTLDFGAPALKPGTVRVGQDTANLRSGPGLKYAKIGSLKPGAVLTLLSRSTDWLHVRTAAGTTGWVAQEVLDDTTAARAGIVSESRTNLRLGPGEGYGVITRLSAGTRVSLLARHGDWLHLRTAHGTTGWVHSDLIDASAAAVRGLPTANDVPAASQARSSTEPAASNESYGATARGYTAASIAMRYIGSRYAWGGASPRGFDCSGLVLYVYRRLGLSLPHKASGMYSTRYGSRVYSMGALRAGDIVFFANTAGWGITHVAVYVGNGRMVTANSPRTGVQLQSIFTSYWSRHFAGAIRPY